MPNRSARTPVVGIGGLGYMGLATGLGFAHRGVRVLGYELRTDVRTALRQSKTPIFEPGLPELLRQERRSGRFDLVDSWEELVERSDIIYLCLPTPAGPDGRIDLGPLRTGTRALATALAGGRKYRLVVVKSTVVPGTTEDVVRPLLEQVSGRTGTTLGVATNPEFLAEGTMVRDATSPDRIVIGTSSRKDERLLKRIYALFPSQLVVLSPTEAELTKYSSNAFLALKVTFANEVSRLAERVGASIDPVMGAVGLDPRVGPRFLSAGPGFGGSCFEKDVLAFATSSRSRGVRMRLIEALVPSNEDQTDHAFDRIRQAVGPLRGRTVALLGLAFKAGTDDVRESRALALATAIRRAGGRLRLHDPVAAEKFRALWKPPGGVRSRGVRYCRTPIDALRGADVAVLQVAWPDYLRWPPAWTGVMRRPVVVDLRRALPPSVRERAHLEWHGLGVSETPRRRSGGRSRADAPNRRKRGRGSR
jgi:UDPglucose 6-dehydrogenase